MGGIDDRISHLMGGGTAFGVVLLVAVLLGLRHASDPDHLAAVSTLVATDPETGRRRAARLGAAWGCGHASALILLGTPIVMFKGYLPGVVQRGAEILVGLVIIALALRVLWRVRRGDFRHHVHPHGARTGLQSFGVGMVHGTGGSAGVGVLLLAGIPDQATATAALAWFALATAVSMTALSSIVGWALTRGPVLQRVMAVVPMMALGSLIFGVYYVLGAAGAVPYAI